MSAILAGMSKKRPAPSDRHKPRRLVGVSERICLALEEIGKDRESTLTEMVKVGLISYFESPGKWPPTPKSGK